MYASIFLHLFISSIYYIGLLSDIPVEKNPEKFKTGVLAIKYKGEDKT